MGGSWERIEDVFLLCAGTTYAAGSTGGAATHSHGLGNGYARILMRNDRITGAIKGTPMWRATMTSNDAGEGKVACYEVSWNGQETGAELGGTTDQASDMPPYRAIYAWERVA